MAWRLIESAPKDGTEVFLWRKDWPCPIVSRWSDRGYGFWIATEYLLHDAMGDIEGATHWMPIPPLPDR